MRMGAHGRASPTKILFSLVFRAWRVFLASNMIAHSQKIGRAGGNSRGDPGDQPGPGLHRLTVGQIPNPIHPDQLSAKERIAEIGELLARGLVRLHARQSSYKFSPDGDSSLDFTPDQRGHAEPTTRRQA